MTIKARFTIYSNQKTKKMLNILQKKTMVLKNQKSSAPTPFPILNFPQHFGGEKK